MGYSVDLLFGLVGRNSVRTSDGHTWTLSSESFVARSIIFPGVSICASSPPGVNSRGLGEAPTALRGRWRLGTG